MLKMSVSDAMRGTITANVAGIKGWIEEPAKIVLETYFFVEPTETDLEYINDFETYVIADYPAPYTLETRKQTISLPIPRNLENWLYLRAEAMPNTY